MLCISKGKVRSLVFYLCRCRAFISYTVTFRCLLCWVRCCFCVLFFFFSSAGIGEKSFFFFSVSSAHERSVVCALRLAGFCKRCLWRTTAVAMKFVFFFCVTWRLGKSTWAGFFFFFF